MKEGQHHSAAHESDTKEIVCERSASTTKSKLCSWRK